MTKQAREFWSSEEDKITVRWKDNPKEYFRQYNKRYYLKNRERELKRKRKYYRDNREKEFEYAKKWRENNREKCNEYASVTQHRRKLKVIMELGGKCCRCGYANIAGLVVHHLNPKEKEKDNDFLRKGFDISKLILLCANCHAEEHYLKIWKKFLKREKKL